MKKPLVSIFAGILAATLSVGAFAATSTLTTNSAATKTTKSTTELQKRQNDRPKLTDEQKTQMEAERKAQEAKWAALTDAQKKEINNLFTEKANAETAIVDKYLELDLIDSDKATEMKQDINDRLEKQKTNDKMPMGMMGGKFGDPGHHGDKPGDVEMSDATTSAANNK